MVKIVGTSTEKKGRTEIAANSASFINGGLVQKVGNVVSPATGASTNIIGRATSDKTFASDNETVGLETTEIIDKESREIFRLQIVNGGALTVASEEKYFLLSDQETVDGASINDNKSYVNTSDAGATEDPVINMQVQMTKFISDTEGEFIIVL